MLFCDIIMSKCKDFLTKYICFHYVEENVIFLLLIPFNITQNLKNSLL